MQFFEELFGYAKNIPFWIKILVFLGMSLFFITPLIYTNNLLYPHVQPQVYYLRTLSYGLFPLYVYIITAFPMLRPNVKNKINIIVLAYFGVQALSTFFGINIVRSLVSDNIRMGGLMTQLCFLLIFFYIQLFVKMFGRKAIAYVYNAYLGVATILALYAIMVHYGGAMEQATWGWYAIIEQFAPAQISATLGNPVYFGAFVILPLGIAVWQAFDAKKMWAKGVYGFLAFLQVIALLFTAARGASLGVAFALVLSLVVFFLTIKSAKARSIIIASAGVVILIITLAVLSPSFARSSTLLSRFQVAFNDPASVGMRLQLWRMAATGFLEDPVLGHGQENFPYAFNKYYKGSMYERGLTERQDKPHNFYLELLFSHGVLGFGAFMLGLIVWYMMLYELKKKGELSNAGFIILGSSFAGYLLQYLAFFEITSNTLFYYIFFGAPVGMYAIMEVGETKKAKELNSGLALLFAIAAAVGVLFLLYYVVVSPAYLSRLQNRAAYALSVDKDVSKAYTLLKELSEDSSNFDRPAAAIRIMETTLALKSAQGQGGINQDVINKFEELALAAWERMDIAKSVNSEQIGFYLWFKTMYSQDTNTKLDNDKLEPLIKRMQELGPEKSESYLYAAQYYKQLGDLQKATENVQKATSLNKNDGQSQWLLAGLLRQAGKNDEAATIALNVMQQRMQFSPTNEELIWLASYLTDKKQYDLAGQLVGSLIQSKPSPEAYKVGVRLMVETGKKDEAQKLLDEAKKKYPEDKDIQSIQLP